jgi:hypothetical protein
LRSDLDTIAQFYTRLRDGGRAFERYWTTGRGVEAMDYSYRLMGPSKET